MIDFIRTHSFLSLYVLIFIIVAVAYASGQAEGEWYVTESCREHNGVTINGDFYYCTLLEKGND